MEIRELDTPTVLKNGDIATHRISTSHNGIQIEVFVNARIAWLFERAIEFGEHRAHSKLRDVLNPILWNIPDRD